MFIDNSKKIPDPYSNNDVPSELNIKNLILSSKFILSIDIEEFSKRLL